MILRAPFPYAGGKSRVAARVWARLGPVRHYVEPFAGSLAVLLQRPDEPWAETVNELDGLIVNAWRAMMFAPAEVARLVAWPVSEIDLRARHQALVDARSAGGGATARLEASANTPEGPFP